jgi:hypothetical protein
MDEKTAKALYDSLVLEESIWAKLAQLEANADSTDLRVFMAAILLTSANVENWAEALQQSVKDFPVYAFDFATNEATNEVVGAWMRAIYERE